MKRLTVYTAQPYPFTYIYAFLQPQTFSFSLRWAFRNILSCEVRPGCRISGTDA